MLILKSRQFEQGQEVAEVRPGQVQALDVEEIRIVVQRVGDLPDGKVVEAVDRESARVKKELKNITSVMDFESLLEQVMLSDDEKQILRMHYKEQKTLGYIADVMGLSEIAVKKKHRKILFKIGNMF